MAMPVFPVPSDGYEASVETANIVFAMIFNVEACLKLYVMRQQYFKDNWNVFDFVCVVATDVGLLFQLLGGVQLGPVFSALRLFRIARLFRLIRFAKGLNQLFMAFVFSLPKLANVALLLVLLLFLYSTLGVSLFGKVRASGMHNKQANFRSFYRAWITLLRASTGEAWNEIMHELGRDRFYFESIRGVHCVEDLRITADNFDEWERMGVIEDPIECGTPTSSYVFFVTYMIIVGIVILNLFIAVIFEAFDESSKNEDGEVIQKCIENWVKYDPHYTMVIDRDHALTFIDDVVGQLVRGSPVPHEDGESAGGCVLLHTMDLRYARRLQLKLTEDHRVTFFSAVTAVLRRLCIEGVGPVEQNMREIEHMEREAARGEVGGNKVYAALRRVRSMQHKNHDKMTNQLGQVPGTLMSLEEQIAAAKIQRRFKDLLVAKRQRGAPASSNDAHDSTTINRAAG